MRPISKGDLVLCDAYYAIVLQRSGDDFILQLSNGMRVDAQLRQLEQLSLRSTNRKLEETDAPASFIELIIAAHRNGTLTV